MDKPKLYPEGSKMLITTDGWFFAPDGQSYRAVHGTVKGIYTDEEVLGIKTNAKSTNWYLLIGRVFIAGCQIHYAVETEEVDFMALPDAENISNGKIVKGSFQRTRIYNAD